MTPLSDFEVSKLKHLQGGQNALTEQQITREFEIFQKIYPHGQCINSLSILKKLMLALSERLETQRICQSLIDMQSHKYLKKDIRSGIEQQLPVLPIYINEELEIAQTFVELCGKSMTSLTAQGYLDIYEITKAQIIDKIASIAAIQMQDESLVMDFFMADQMPKRTHHNGARPSLQEPGERRRASEYNKKGGAGLLMDEYTTDGNVDNEDGLAENMDAKQEKKVKGVFSIINQFANHSFDLLNFLKLISA